MPIIEGHPDFAALEARLAALVREAQRDAGAAVPAAVAVIAPTSRLIAHLQQRLAALAPALVNVHFFHHQGLADAARAAAGEASARPLSDDVRAALVARLVEALGGPLAAYARSRPGAVVSLLATLEDLRESGVPPDLPPGLPGLTRRGRDLQPLYASWARALDASGAGPGDRAAAIRLAIPAVRKYASRFRLVVHYGAYDLIGVNLELMRAAEPSAGRLVFLVPWHPTARAFEQARRFWPEFLDRSPAVLPGAPGDRLLADRLVHLYDEEARPGPLDADRRGRVSLFHAQGTEAELREVARRVLALQRDRRVPPHRIGVVARSLEPYAAALGPVFGEQGVPFDSSATLGAARAARVQAVLQLARALLLDFPRQPLLDLCRGGLLRLAGHDAAADAAAWDRLSRDWRVTGGAAVWTRDLVRWVSDWRPYLPPDADADEAERAAARKAILARQAGALAALVDRLQGAGRPLRRASSHTTWASALERLLVDHVDGFRAAGEDGPSDAGAALVLRVLGEMRRLDDVLVPYSAQAALSFFAQSLARARLPIGADADPAEEDADRGGVRVLDAMQARGLSFDSLFLIGFNADLFPRRPGEDPFLADADRRALRAQYRAPLPLKGDAFEEERLLLAHLLGSAEERLTVSWQRADESGRARGASLALREIARVIEGSPDMTRLEEVAHRVPTHPADAGRDALERFGSMPPLDAAVQSALQAGSPRALAGALTRGLLPQGPTSMEALPPGLELLARAEESAPDDLRFDAFVGDAAPPPALFSPSRLETLGACPQNYFFRHVLFVQELEEVREPYELDAREIGSRVHEVLRDVYAGIAGPDGALPAEPIGELAARAGALARAAWTRHLRDLARRTSARYPLLWSSLESLWLDAIDRFLREDLAIQVADGARLVGVEREERARVLLGAGRPALEIRGRLDRLTAGRGGLVVADYKTSGRLDRQVAPADVLKGTRLQMPLYLLLVESRAADGVFATPAARGDLLGVGPAFASAEEDAAARVPLKMSTLESIRDGLLETLATLVDLAATGSYPLNRSSRLCGFCPYTRACRRLHPPTVARVTSAPPGRDYALLRRKNSRAPLLDQVRRGGGDEDEA